MSSPKVSVLITFYNQEKYAARALESVLDQKTDFACEILVGDDGSTDGTRDIVRQWMEKYPGRIELYVMDRTPGKHIGGFRASQNRLNLLKHVKGEYFIYLDGDDYFDYPKKLQKQAEILDAPENQDCIACGHNTDMLYPDGTRQPISPPEMKEGKYSPKTYWKDKYIHTDALLVRSSVIPTIPVKLLENNFNDNLITFSIIQNGNIYYIPQSWVAYAQTQDGIWTGEKTIVNSIRNMFLYDLCNQVNPSMRKETSYRFRAAWLELFKLRRQIHADQLEAFAREAEDKHMEESVKWLHYGELPLWEKLRLCILAFVKNWKIYFRALLKRVLRCFGIELRERG